VLDCGFDARGETYGEKGTSVGYENDRYLSMTTERIVDSNLLEDVNMYIPYLDIYSVC
jgi:hypothetical protein